MLKRVFQGQLKVTNFHHHCFAFSAMYFYSVGDSKRATRLAMLIPKTSHFCTLYPKSTMANTKEFQARVMRRCTFSPTVFIYLRKTAFSSSMKRMRTYSSCTERVFRVLFPVLTKHTIEAPTDTGVSGNLVLFRTPLTRHYFMVTYLYLVF